MAIIHIIILFVGTPRKFITAKLSIRKPGSSSVLTICFNKLCSNTFTWFFHKQNYYMFIDCLYATDFIKKILIVYIKHWVL
jgi:hypothetical protein